jgi:hypothetical protein
MNPAFDPTSARLYALIARKARKAVLFRRGPSRWTRLIAWDLATDQLTPGQWIRGRVYERRSDLSPNGELLSAFVAKHVGPYGSWTTISRPPFFTALALWPKDDAWGGGGLFASDESFGLNHRFPAEPAPIDPRKGERAPSGEREDRDRHGRRRKGKITKAQIKARRAAKTARSDLAAPMSEPIGEHQLAEGFWTPPRLKVAPVADWAGAGEDDPIRAARMERDGWRLTRGGGGTQDFAAKIWIDYKTPHVWRRRVGPGRVLALRELGVKEREGRWHVESGAIEDEAQNVRRELGRVDFLDADHNGDALYGWAGQLWRLRGADPAAAPVLIADLNSMRPVALPSPDWARDWP